MTGFGSACPAWKASTMGPALLLRLHGVHALGDHGTELCCQHREGVLGDAAGCDALRVAFHGVVQGRACHVRVGNAIVAGNVGSPP